MEPKFLEDLTAGDTFTSAGRTLTEADVVGFAGISGDFNPIHTDVEFAKETPYGQRVVYGLLGISILTGLLDRTGLFSGSAIAMLGINTVHFRLTITDVRRTSKPDRGVVGRFFELINQDGVVVQQGNIDLMVRSRQFASA
jgi:acyl dehydratase